MSYRKIKYRSDMISKLTGKHLTIFRDDRGKIFNFKHDHIKNLHIVTVKPGSIRGNHSHQVAEFIWVINGNNICEIDIKKDDAYEEKKIIVKKDIEAYKIEANVHHKIKNNGKSVFYLVCFNEY